MVTKSEIQEQVMHVPLDDLYPNPWQPESRVLVDEETAKQFAASILEFGLIQTPVVRQTDRGYEMGDGWLRKAGYEYLFLVESKVEYHELPVMVRELTDRQMADLVMEANAVRKDLNPIELAQFYKKYLEDFSVTQSELARRHNCSQGEIANTLRLLELPGDIQKKIISQEISETHGRELLRLNKHPERQQKVLKSCEGSGLSVSELSDRIETEVRSVSKSLDPRKPYYYDPPRFDVSGCQKCQHAEKLGKELRCNNPDCWNRKQKEAQAAELEKKKEELREQGIERIYQSGELSYNEYDRLWDDFLEKHPECQTCAHHAALLHFYDDGHSIVCIDRECYEQKRKQMNEEAGRERQRERQELEERISRAVDGCADMTLAMRTIIMFEAEDYGLAELLDMPPAEEGEEDLREEEAVKKLEAMTLPDLIKLLLRFRLKENIHDINLPDILDGLEGKAPAPADEVPAEETPPEPEAPPAETDAEPILGLPCGDCIHKDTCDRSYFYADGHGGYICDRKETVATWPDAGEIKAQAEEEIAADNEHKARETKFTKSTRCKGCHETKMMEFHLDPEDNTAYHWKATCRKCQTVNSIKNARWDGMMGIKAGADESA